MLSSAVNTSVSWCQAHLPVEVAREKIPLVDTSLRLADAYGMPVVVKIDSAIDGVVNKGNYYVLSVRDKSVVAVEAVQGVRDSLRVKEEGLRNKLDGLITEKRNDFVNAKDVVITKATDTYHVVSSRLQSVPRSPDLDIHVMLDQDSRLVGAVLGLRDRLLVVTAKGLDMTVGNEKRTILFDKGSAVYERALEMARRFFGVDHSEETVLPTSPAGSAQAVTDKASETSTVEPVNVLKEQKESMVDEKTSEKVKSSSKPKDSNHAH
ncbi:Histone deacetylase complex subunit sap18 [Perkinsus olseni]|uniref:Histone deacetylase complex subunit sap18 n=1 Tax=Perkinsus olseni TaxID=32597 RepID=A0A7J6UPQ7_PEROL|nr:Histone deacetylase complex subunit sap18 [Perkinsus olseni]